MEPQSAGGAVHGSGKESNRWHRPDTRLRLNVECSDRPRFFYIAGVEVVKISGRLREISCVGFWLCGVLFLSGIVEAADHPALQPVKELFAAMSKHDGKAMQETSTEDFQLLEHGEDWTMQKLVDAVQPKGDPVE